MPEIPHFEVLLTLAGMITGIIAMMIRVAMRLSVLEFKVATMWGFQMRRGFLRGLGSGIGTINSPLHFNPEIERALDPIRQELIEFGRQLCGASDVDGLLLIELAFGERLINIMCVPCGLSHAACLLLAYTVATGKNEIEVITPPPPAKGLHRALIGVIRSLSLAPLSLGKRF